MSNRSLIIFIACLAIVSSARLEVKQTRSTSSTNWWDVPTTTAASETRWWYTSSTAATRPWWDTTSWSSPATTTRPWWDTTSATATTRPWWDTSSSSATTRPWWDTVTRSWSSSSDVRPPWWTQTTAWITSSTSATPTTTSFSYANFYIVDIRDQLRYSVDTVLQGATYEFVGNFPYLTPPMDGYEYRLFKVVNGTKDELVETVRGNILRFSVDVSHHEKSFSFVVRYDKIGGQMGSALYSSNTYTVKTDNWNAWKPMCDYKAVSAISENSTVAFYARGDGCSKNVPLKVHIQGGKLDKNNHGLNEMVTLNTVRPAPYSNTIQYMSEMQKSDRQSAASTSVTFVLENNNFPGSQMKVNSNVLYVF